VLNALLDASVRPLPLKWFVASTETEDEGLAQYNLHAARVQIDRMRSDRRAAWQMAAASEFYDGFV
jgi:hypothetical protein